jgi:hypothetical protein
MKSPPILDGNFNFVKGKTQQNRAFFNKNCLTFIKINSLEQKRGQLIELCDFPINFTDYLMMVRKI